MPAPRAPLLIINPAAAQGRASELAQRLEEVLGQGAAKARLVETREAGHAEELAAAATEQGHDRVIAVGGDGTAQEVLNGLMVAGVGPDGGPPAFGLVPGGTGNDLARSLGLPLTLMEALTVALGESTRPMDLAQASHDGETRYFAAAGGTGFDAQVAFTMGGKRARWQRGRAGYVLSAVNELRRYKNRTLSLRLVTDAGVRKVDGKFLFVVFANTPYYGGGMRICPDASIDDGLLDLCLAGDIGRLGALRELPGIYRGAHVNHPLVEMTRVRELRIEGEEGTRVHLDGEPFGMLPVDLAVREAAVAVAAPMG